MLKTVLKIAFIIMLNPIRPEGGGGGDSEARMIQFSTAIQKRKNDSGGKNSFFKSLTHFPGVNI